jgi:methylated-DNA-protein-cysteine methyltransferase-like protein
LFIFFSFSHHFSLIFEWSSEQKLAQEITIVTAQHSKTIKPMSENKESTYHKIYQVVRQIPAGKVATYGQVADLAGLYGQARLVGYALYRVDLESDIPWQRVVNAQGEISYAPTRTGGDYLQKNLLEQEGLQFNQQGKIDLKVYRWQAPINLLDADPV